MGLKVEHTKPLALSGILDEVVMQSVVQPPSCIRGNAEPLQSNPQEYLVFSLLFGFLDQKDLKMYLTVLHINLFHLLQMRLQVPYLHHKEQFRYNVDDRHKFLNKWLDLHFRFSGSKMYIFQLYVFSS